MQVLDERREPTPDFDRPGLMAEIAAMVNPHSPSALPSAWSATEASSSPTDTAWRTSRTSVAEDTVFPFSREGAG